MKRKTISDIPYGLIVPLYTGLIVHSSFGIVPGMQTWVEYYNTQYSQTVAATPAVSSITKQPPTSVYIPKINKRLPIQAGIADGNTWSLFDSSVAWLSTSAVPNEGNVILYAHNWQSLWGNLYTLQPGDLIEVTQNKTIIHYEVTESRAVNKEDIQAILSHENMLTMFTCEGTFDEKRRVVYAKPL